MVPFFIKHKTMNITDEQNTNKKPRHTFEERFGEFKEAPKSKFQLIAEKTTPKMRMEMMQMGLNPFNEDDLEQFHKVQKGEFTLSFWSRLKAACSFLFNNEINGDLELIVIKHLNTKTEEARPVKTGATVDHINDTFKAPAKATMNPKQAHAAAIIEKAESLPLSPMIAETFIDKEEYQSSILSSIESRLKEAEKPKEETAHTIEVPNTDYIDTPIPEGITFIPGNIPTVIETVKPEVKKKTTAKRKAVEPKKVIIPAKKKHTK
jgi:hypothetical protein